MTKYACFLLISIAFWFSWSSEAEASHFRYGTIYWRIPNPATAPRTVEFTVQQAWRTSFVGCSELNFGDGTTSSSCGTATTIGTGVDSLNESYTVLEYVVTKTYAGAATSFLAFFEGCCRISTLENGADDPYRVETQVSLAPGNTSGPVSASPPIRQMQVGNVRTLFFPFFDPDQDPVTCRLATDAEAGFPGSVPSILPGGAQPSLSSVAGGCQLTWNATNATGGDQYVVHVVVESVHGGVTSSTQLDLIVEMVTPPPPVCTGGGTFVVDPGDPLLVPTLITDPGMVAGNTTMTAINDPAGSMFTPPEGTAQAAPWSSTFSWTPTVAAAGSTTIVIVNYTNAINLTGTCFLTIQVPQCANFGDACTVGVGACQATGTNVCAGPGVTQCNATPGAPTPEVCDGIDNNCNGTTDDNPALVGTACASGLPGVCSTGTRVCQAGALSCDPTIDPGMQAETCDALDNDCDGMADEGFNLGAACTNGVGQCQSPGVIVCSAGAGACNAVPGVPTMEACDGLDNDCDGTSDDGNPGGGIPCPTGLPGQCSIGATLCAGGQVSCDPTTSPGEDPELCTDLLDSDCDGLPSNGCNGDTDGDGIPDVDEDDIGTDPNDADSDDDGVIDGLEPQVGEDTDGDGLSNGLDPDSDNDGLYDGTELGFDCSNPATDVTLDHCIPDGDDGATTTDPLDADSDDGSVSDGEEDVNLNGVVDEGETDPTTGNGDDDINEDSDGDGLVDVFEEEIGTDPNDADSDDDGIIDGEEPNPADDTDGDGLINALDPDSDNDELFDGTEVGNDCDNPATDLSVGNCIADGDDGATTTSPLDPDTDDGGVSDGNEDDNHNGVVDGGETDPTTGNGGDDFNNDLDGDGLTNEEEEAIGTDPNDADSDDDGLIDGDEPSYDEDTDGDGLINALDPDSDNDGLFDGTELGLDCSNPATDESEGNCIADGDDGDTVTDPLDPDTDDGSVSDGDEDLNHNGVVDDGETDPNVEADDVPVVECTEDADCGNGSSGLVCNDDGECQDGCRGQDGNGCPDGERCTSDDATIGECVPVECTDDADCGNGSSGRVCNEDRECEDGCRGEGGNGCPDGETCTSEDESIGECVDNVNVYAEGNGIFCTSSVPSNDNSGWLVGLALLGLSLSRRRR